jgi:three-Cys-motif partner protein
MTTYCTDGTVGPWAQEKLAYLKSYLNAYTQVLLKQKWCKGTYYFDAFAGAGEAKLRKPENRKEQSNIILPTIVEEDADFTEYIQGSPRVSLEIEHPFTHYFFVENNPAHIEKLKQLKNEYSTKREITIYPGEATKHINTFIEYVNDWKKYRAVAFLDPFGMQVPWDTICAIAQKKSIEIILNLPIGTTIQRLIKRDSSKMSIKDMERLTSYFGSGEWEQIVYNYDGSKQTSFLDDTESIIKYDNAALRLVAWYKSRLEEIFGCTAGPKLITNTQGAHLYYLIWAGAHKKGQEIAAYILGDRRSI